MSMEKNELIEKGNAWLRSLGHLDNDIENFNEYASGQIEFAINSGIDSLRDWDEWQHLQACMGVELSMKLATQITSMLWENEIEVMELETEKSNQYYSAKTKADNIPDSLKNIITAVGCNQKEFLEIIKNCKEEITMSSESYYADYWIYGGDKLLAIYDCKGNLKYYVQVMYEEV